MSDSQRPASQSHFLSVGVSIGCRSEGSSGRVLLDGGEADVGGAMQIAGLALRARTSTTSQLTVEVSAETLTEQVERERVDAGRGEAEDPGQKSDDEVGQRQIHLVVVEGAVHVEDVVWEPAQGEQAHKNQHDLSQTLPRLHWISHDQTSL